MTRTTVVVLGGGPSSEHDVSLASARSIASALDVDRYDVDLLVIERDGSWRAHDETEPFADGIAHAVRRLRAADVVIPALHGPGGEDGTIAGLLDVIGVPYVGSGVGAGALAMDKVATKLVAAAHGVRTASGVIAVDGELTDEAVAGLRFPVVVKPSAAGSSHGVSRVDAIDGLPAALTRARRLDRTVLIEQFVTGREIDLAVVENPDGSLTVGPPLEVPRGAIGVFDAEAKYAGDVPFVIPAPVEAGLLRELERAATTMFRALGCRGLARVDFFVDEHGPLLNEVNTMPGFTASSQVPRMFAAVGLPYPQLLDLLIDTARSHRGQLAEGRAA